MTEHRDAMKAAVEALETAQSWQEYADEEEREQVRAALSLLRAALEARETVKHWCETCEGLGTIDETLGGESFSNPKATCPDCDGQGWWTPSRQAASPVAAPVEAREPVGEVVLFGSDLKEVSWRKGKMPSPGTKLYASPVADAQRLEWIANQGDEFSSGILQDCPGDGDCYVSGMNDAYGTGKTFRDAIDSAMKEQPSDGAALCAKGLGGCVAGECGKEEKRG